MTSPISNSPSVANAESDAVVKERAEAVAEERFRAMRTQLEHAGQPQAVTHTPEFRQWMQARAETDDAWGRWAVAVDQARTAS